MRRGFGKIYPKILWLLSYKKVTHLSPTNLWYAKILAQNGNDVTFFLKKVTKKDFKKKHSLFQFGIVEFREFAAYGNGVVRGNDVTFFKKKVTKKDFKKKHSLFQFGLWDFVAMQPYPCVFLSENARAVRCDFGKTHPKMRSIFLKILWLLSYKKVTRPSPLPIAF